MKSMDASVEENIAELKQKASKTSAEIKSKALEKAVEIKKLHMESAAKAIALERHKHSYAANSESRKQIGSLRHEIFNEAFERARARLVSIRENIDYTDSFRKMAEDAVQALGEDEVVLHVDKKDADLCRKIANGLDKRCEVVADISCSGGLNATTKDGKVIVYNTAESRLECARRRMRLEIFNMLKGGHE